MAAFFLPPGDGRPFCIHTGTPRVGIGPHDVALSICVAMVKAGLGWSIVPEICLSYFDGIAEPLFFVDDTPLTRSTYLLYRRRETELPQVRAFIQTLCERENIPSPVPRV